MFWVDVLCAAFAFSAKVLYKYDVHFEKPGQHKTKNPKLKTVFYPCIFAPKARSPASPKPGTI